MYKRNMSTSTENLTIKPTEWSKWPIRHFSSKFSGFTPAAFGISIISCSFFLHASRRKLASLFALYFFPCIFHFASPPPPSPSFQHVFCILVARSVCTLNIASLISLWRTWKNEMRILSSDNFVPAYHLKYPRLRTEAKKFISVKNKV